MADPEDSKTFHDITASQFTCTRKRVEDNFGGKFVPPDTNSGVLTVTIGGHFPAQPTTYELNFDFNEAAADLTFTLIKQAGSLPVSVAWYWLGQAISDCGGKGNVDQ